MNQVSNPFTEKSEAERYNLYRPAYHQLPFEKLHHHLDRKFEAALDVACGTGHSTRALAHISQSVIGCDLSEAMLLEARKSSNLQFILSPAENLPFENQSFDYVHISMAFQWLDQKQFLSEVRRVLKPKGYFGIDNYGCTGQMKEREDFRDLYRNFDRQHLPSASRSPDFPSEEQCQANQFQQIHEIKYEEWVSMTSDQFTNYLMTRSNFLVLSDEAKTQMSQQLFDYYRPLFGERAQEIRFVGQLRLYQPNP